MIGATPETSHNAQRPAPAPAIAVPLGGQSAPRATSARHVLGMLVAVYTMSTIDRHIFYVVAPLIQADLRLSDTELGLLSGLAFALFYATVALPIARVAERRSRAKMISVALLLWSAMTGLCGVAANFWQLFLARLGVGVGEGACSPCAQSMICDLYPPERRATALAIYAAGVPVGIMIGSVSGAWIGQILGWRGAFFVAAVPGILLALLFYWTVREPARGAKEVAYVDGQPPSFLDVVKTLSRSPSFRYTAIGYAIAGIPGTAMHIFLTTHLVRSFGLDPLPAGVIYGLAAGITGIIGMILGGRVTDYFGGKDIRAYGFVPAAAFLCLTPLLILALTSDNLAVFGLLIALPAILYLFNIGASYAVTNNLVEPRMRATASAILLMIITIFSSGAGPAAVGGLSDLLAVNQFGPDYASQCVEGAARGRAACRAAAGAGLKYALIAASLLYVVSALLYLRLGLVIGREMGGSNGEPQ